jgi:hypothetical protein
MPMRRNVTIRWALVCMQMYSRTYDASTHSMSVECVTSHAARSAERRRLDDPYTMGGPESESASDNCHIMYLVHQVALFDGVAFG